MGKLEIKKLNHDVINGVFDCGNDSINRQIEESYFPTLLQYSYAYEVSVSNCVVGYYMIKFRTIKFELLPVELKDYYSSLIKDCCALHINYIAIDKKFQGRKIGTNVLKIIIAQVVNICNQWPITIITLDALKEKYEWYKKIGFLAFSEEDVASKDITIPMYISCILNKEAVNNYSEV